MKKKFIGRHVILDFNGSITLARITGIEFHPLLGKPVFHFMSSRGNWFQLTRRELEEHEIIR